MDKSTVFDPEKLDSLKEYRDENDQDLRISIVNTYNEEAKRLIADLKAATNFSDRSGVAHSLKSSTAAVGGVTLSELFAKIEHEDLNEADLKSVLQQVDQRFDELKKLLDSYMKATS